MKFNRTLRIFSGLLWLGLFAAPHSTPSFAQAATQKPVASQKRLAWRVKSDTAEVTLLGSIHLGSKGMYPMPKEIETAYNTSQNLVVEIDLNKIDQAAIMSTVQTTGIYKGNETLWKHIKPATAEALKKFCKTYVLPESALDKMKPWLVGITVALLPLQQAGMEAELGIDRYFLDKAKDKKNVISLETADWQIKLLSSVPEELQDTYLLETIQQSTDPKLAGQQMVKLWMDGDPVAFSKWVDKNMKMPGDMGRKLLEDRNHPMADAIEKLLKGNEKSFVVVGAAHMVGKEGIVALLSAKGYKVTQIEISPNETKSVLATPCVL